MKFIEVTKRKGLFSESYNFLLSVDKIIFIMESGTGGTYIEHVGGYEENGFEAVESYEEVKKLIEEATQC